MKIQIASDLHLEFFEKRFPDYRVVEPADADILVLAGDIHRHAAAADAFRDWPCPVLLLHGNHELYRSVAEDTLRDLRGISKHGQVRYMERDALVIGDVRFLGCCLWTDYALDGDPALAMRVAADSLMDYRQIRTTDGLFTPEDALAMHRMARAWLTDELARPFAGKTVVITHHGPHPGSIDPRYAGDPMNPCFISDLTPLVEQADLWLHGHVHSSFDYRVGATRIVANPRGYASNWREAAAPSEFKWENPAFDPTLVVRI